MAATAAAEMASVVALMAGEANVELEQIVVVGDRRRSLRILTVAVIDRVLCFCFACCCMCRRLLGRLSACSVPCCRLIWMRYI
jgi:hypothetical protein